MRRSRVVDSLLYTEFSAYRACRPSIFGAVGDTCANPLYHAFRTSKQDGKGPLFPSGYPVATRLQAQVTDFWAEATSEFSQRLAIDRSALERTFNDGKPLGRVVNLETDASDPHEGGRAVIIVQFESGRKLVYKPRPAPIEAFYDELLAWLNVQDRILPLKRLTLLSRSTHGWIEYVEHRECASEEEVHRFYQRCGMLLCLAYICNGTDFHRENLIACGEHPVLIDMEGLLKPNFDLEALLPTQDLVAPAAKHHCLRSVLSTRMLPLLRVVGDGQAVDTSSLGSRELYPISVSRWADVNQDTMRPERRAVVSEERSKNKLWLNGEPTHASNYADEIAEGFRRTYEVFATHRDELLKPGGLMSEVKGKPIRFILRNTSLYATLIEHSLHPKYLCDETARREQFHVLYRTFEALDDRPDIWPAVADEIRALDQLDIPLFKTYTDSTALELSTGKVLPDIFAHSAYDEACKRLRDLSEDDLRFQVASIYQSFQATSTVGLVFDGAQESGGENSAQNDAEKAISANNSAISPDEQRFADMAVNAAWQVAKRLERIAIPTDNGGLAWMGTNYLARARRHELGPQKMNLFSGYTGTALFLAALAHVTEAPKPRRLALAALVPLCSRLAKLEKTVGTRHSMNIGGLTGLGSVVHALSKVGTLLNEPSLHQDAQQIVLLLDPERLNNSERCDTVSGAAGAALSLLKLHEATGDEAALYLAGRWGTCLLEAREEESETGLQTWPSRPGIFETGFAHGQSGIACALWRLGIALDDAAMIEAANEAAAYERHILGEDLTGAAAIEKKAAWSHGATGIGLARLAGYEATGCSAMRSDLEAALQITCSQLSSGGDSLCTGRAGRIDFLISAASALARPTLHDVAMREAVRLTSQNDNYRLGWSNRAYDTGLFLGSAGVSYALLRAAYPEKLAPLL